MLIFTVVCLLGLFALLLLQGILPLNPQSFGGVDPILAFNIATSFVTNANWQAYGGETTLSHLSQMVGGRRHKEHARSSPRSSLAAQPYSSLTPVRPISSRSFMCVGTILCDRRSRRARRAGALCRC
jgi:hypothetical protein